MKKSVLCAAVVSVVSMSVNADYEAEAGFAYSDIEDFDAITISGELFFDSVSTSKGPHAEASFLDKASSVMASYSDVDDADDNPFNVGARFVTSTDLIIEGGYQDLGPSENVRFGVGAYIDGSSDIVVSYTSNNDNDLDILAADYHRVDSLGGGNSLAYTVGGSYVDAANDNGFGIAGDVTYYPDNNLGFGGNVAIVSVDNFDVTTLGLHIDYFFTPDLHLQGSYSSVDNDGAIEDIDTFTIGVFVRF